MISLECHFFICPVEIQIITVYSETFKGHIRVPINSRILSFVEVAIFGRLFMGLVCFCFLECQFIKVIYTIYLV